MDYNRYKMEIERAYRVLPAPQAETQNARDIRGWLGAGYVKPLEAKSLFEYNAQLYRTRGELHKYEAKIYSYKTGDMYMFCEQPRHHLDKEFIKNLMSYADTLTCGDDPMILIIIWRDGDPVLFGSVRSWMDGSTVYARRTVSRWENRNRVEWERHYTLAE